MNKKYHQDQVQKETEENIQHRLSARRGCTREYIKHQILNETLDEMQSGLEKTRKYKKGYTKRVQDLTPEELEKRRRMERERRKNMTEEQRQRKREQNRLASIKRKMKETPEQQAKRQDIMATYYRRRLMQMTEAEREAKLERTRKMAVEKRMQETEEERGKRLERYRLCNERYSSSNQTPEEREAKLQRERERYKNKTEEQRQRTKEMARLRYLKQKKKNATMEQRAESSDESTDALDIRNLFRESDEIFSDSDADDDQTKSSSKESECSMTLAEKWGLRPLMVRLERIDVAEFAHKIKQESAPDDDSVAVKVKRTKIRNGCVAAPSELITRWL